MNLSSNEFNALALTGYTFQSRIGGHGCESCSGLHFVSGFNSTTA